GRQAEQHAIGVDAGPVDDVVTLDGADGKAGQVILPVAVHARHFRGLAADEGAAGLPTAFGNARYHLGCRVDIKAAAAEVVEKEQWLGSTDQNIVDAHGDQVDSDGVVPAQFAREQQFGAYPVGTGNKHRIAKPLSEVKQSAESAQAAKY